MPTPTLVLTPRHTDDSQALWRAAVRLGWDVERLPSWRVPESLRSTPEPVLYVEALFGPSVAEQLGVTLAEPQIHWLPQLPEEYRRRWVYLTDLGEARRRLTVSAFVKPPNDKCFPALVYSAETLPSDLPDVTPVLVAEVVAWQVEFRCFILDRALRTFSVYARDGELQAEAGYAHSTSEEAQLRSFVESLLADYRVQLPRATVVDVGIIEGRGWAVVEQNGAWGAGLYGSDPAEALLVIRHATLGPPASA